MAFWKKIFTWWDGSTIGTDLFTRRFGEKVGTDADGNVYYGSKKSGRRWVIYNGANDASRIPPEWHGWMHHQIDGLPDDVLPPVRKWEKEPTPNLTGTAQAYRPPGALERGGHRAAASGDYQAWTPE
jgi:NADH:ubiquinone oxidoreductase subunit